MDKEKRVKPLNAAIDMFVDGVVVNDYIIYAKNVLKGRFPEEKNLDVYLKSGGGETHLLFIRIYEGWGSNYRPWVEFSGINKSVSLGDEVFEYLDSDPESTLLTFFSKSIPPGGKIYVEYTADKETGIGLLMGAPAPVTRLGYKLFGLGFTWFKDWYFPEGGKEGGEKLEGEKPIDKEARERHLKMIRREVGDFVMRTEKSTSSGDEIAVVRALGRGKDLLNKLKG
jgi:hypothetical protein